MDEILSKLINTNNDEIGKFIDKLKKKEIDFFDVPKELRLHTTIVGVERELGIRRTSNRGFDIINNTFFVEEIVLDGNGYFGVVEKNIINYFSNFESYYKFLDGDIYENACYFQYNFKEDEIKTYNIELSKINNKSIINFTINDFNDLMFKEEQEEYFNLENNKDILRKWVSKLNSCNTYEEFKNVLISLNKLKPCNVDIRFFIFNFIFSNNDKAFDILMEYICDNRATVYGVETDLCLIYNPKTILNLYNIECKSSDVNNRRKKSLTCFIKNIENSKVQMYESSYFDEKTHFFCNEVRYNTDSNNPHRYIGKTYRYFETFEGLVEYLNGDLSNCDLSKAMLTNIDFDIYKKNEYTKLPIKNLKDLNYNVYKQYDRKNNEFVVRQNWSLENGDIVKEYTKSFKYFFDFLKFLNNDLTNADLLFCDGLDNLSELSNITFTNAILKSSILDRLGFKYESLSIDHEMIKEFPNILKNEGGSEDKLDVTFIREESYKNQKVYYITDLHLVHNVNADFCKSKSDAIYTVQKIIDNLLKDIERLEKNIILIGGDTSSDFNIFNLFIEQLRYSLDEKKMNIQVVFLLGNHELWGFNKYSFYEIVQEYEKIINKNKMHLLQNNILYKDDKNYISKITTQDIIETPKEVIRAKLKTARLILFGGLGFSGRNNEFNANNGIYRWVINRQEELEESKKIDILYNIVCNTLDERNVIIFTHTPKKDWSSTSNLKTGFIYVSGHNHRNEFYDDGEQRVYADNQIGYNIKKPSLKYFSLEDDYDWFSEYKDGTYEITKEEYIKFYRGKNIKMQFRREINKLYMLKKGGYYCFIHQSKNNQLTILNGGSMKKLSEKYINYYYLRMDSAIAKIKKPLDEYTKIQKIISREIKVIGGSGIIHGAIIDIDYYNHIYVNPYDLKITGYWASDIINKEIFKSVPHLLKENCPQLYNNYQKLLHSKSKDDFLIKGDKSDYLTLKSEKYLETDMYKSSREIVKMQKLSSNILTAWYDTKSPLLK